MSRRANKGEVLPTSQSEKGQEQQPIVLLSDCNKKGRTLRKREKADSNNVVNGMLTPISESSAETAESKPRPAKRRKRTWDPKALYEVENIVGYYRDRNGRISYLIKWKHWGHKYNSFEPLEHLENCNYLLMKHFEYKPASVNEIMKVENEINLNLLNNEGLIRLERSNYSRKDIVNYSKNFLDISKVFTNDFPKFHKKIITELDYIIRCIIGMENHRDQGMTVRGACYRIALTICEKRQNQLESLKLRSEQINEIENVPIIIENEVDLEKLPDYFVYITEMKMGEGVVIPQDSIIGCKCPKGCNATSEKCCPVMAGSYFAYDEKGKLRLGSTSTIYECNSKCACPPTCPNRIVQKGRTVEVTLYRTTEYGWGVKAGRDIKQGEYICEYIGELITETEANKRDVAYNQNRLCFLFNLDYSIGSSFQYCIDSTYFGNISRFVNHSCEPNLIVYPIWIDCLDANLPRLAFYAKRDIPAGEELTIDYSRSSDGQLVVSEDNTPNGRKIRCRCNSTHCRQWIF